MFDFSEEIKIEEKWRKSQPIPDIFLKKILKSKNIDSVPYDCFQCIYHLGGFIKDNEGIEILKQSTYAPNLEYPIRILIQKGIIANLAKNGSKSILLSNFPAARQGVGKFLKEENGKLFFKHMLPQHSICINFYIDKDINSLFLQKELIRENNYLLQYRILEFYPIYSRDRCFFDFEVILEKEAISLSQYGLTLNKEGFFKKL